LYFYACSSEFGLLRFQTWVPSMDPKVYQISSWVTNNKFSIVFPKGWKKGNKEGPCYDDEEKASNLPKLRKNQRRGTILLKSQLTSIRKTMIIIVVVISTSLLTNLFICLFIYIYSQVVMTLMSWRLWMMMSF